MKQNDSANYSLHREAWLLLPWYVNGSLEDDDKHLVEEHLNMCLSCRVELENQRMLLEKVRETITSEIAGQASFLRLQKRVYDASDHSPLQTTIAIWVRNYRERASHMRSRYLAAFVLSVLLILLIPILIPAYFVTSRLQETEYRTLANTKMFVTSEKDIRVVFADGLKRKRMDQILSSVHGQIVEGPDTNSVFRVRIDNQQNGVWEQISAISVLRKNTAVVFVEPFFSLSSSIDPEGNRK